MSLLSISNLVAGYGDFQALFGVSLSVEEGKIVAIIGSNGAGKTTLLKTITGLLHPQQATDVQFDGNPIGSYEPGNNREARYRDGSRGTSRIRVPQRRRQPPYGRQLRPLGPMDARAGATPFSPTWQNDVLPCRRRFQVASNKCWPSAGRLWPIQDFYFVTSSVLDLHRLSFATFTQPCLGSGLKGRQS